MKNLIIVMLLFFVNWCFAKELTNEYKEARENAYFKINESYKNCRINAREYKFWISSSKCMNKDLKGSQRCFDITHHNLQFIEKDYLHCESFKPTLADFEEYLSNIIREENIRKYK